MQNTEYKVLFVCMGNICRSPSAEGYFRDRVANSPLAGQVLTDSAGTHGYHIGDPPDSRAVATAASRGVDISDLRARKVSAADFREFDLVIAMDDVNLSALSPMQGTGDADLKLMMEFSPQFAEQREVPDPYYGGQQDFEFMCDLLDEASTGLLKHVEQELQRRG